MRVKLPSNEFDWRVITCDTSTFLFITQADPTILILK